MFYFVEKRIPHLCSSGVSQTPTKPADNRKEMFFKVSEPVYPGQHLPSAACGVKEMAALFFLPFFIGTPFALCYTSL